MLVYLAAMKRSDFLNALSIFFGAGIVSMLRIKSENKVFLLDCPVAGAYYYKYSAVKEKIGLADKLILIREKKNKYDSDAVAIYYKTFKIGYLPRDKNTIIAGLLDQGQKISGFIYSKSKLRMKLYFMK